VSAKKIESRALELYLVVVHVENKKSGFAAPIAVDGAARKGVPPAIAVRLAS